jgi:hypothetical protein
MDVHKEWREEHLYKREFGLLQKLIRLLKRHILLHPHKERIFFGIEKDHVINHVSERERLFYSLSGSLSRMRGCRWERDFDGC